MSKTNDKFDALKDKTLVKPKEMAGKVTGDDSKVEGKTQKEAGKLKDKRLI